MVKANTPAKAGPKAKADPKIKAKAKAKTPTAPSAQNQAQPKALATIYASYMPSTIPTFPLQLFFLFSKGSSPALSKTLQCPLQV